VDVAPKTDNAVKLHAARHTELKLPEPMSNPLASTSNQGTGGNCSELSSVAALAVVCYVDYSECLTEQ
jgi:hypothetical protein